MQRRDEGLAAGDLSAGRDGSAWAIGDELTVQAFALAGFRAVVAGSAAEVVDGVAGASEAGATLVLVTACAARLLSDGGGSLEYRVRPVIVIVPSVVGPPGGEASEASLRGEVRRALGLAGLGAAPGSAP